MAAGRTQPIPTVSSGARAASLGGTRRDLGLDLARAFAVLSLLIPFGYWLQLIPVSWTFWIPQTLVPAEPLFAAILGAAAWRYARTANFPQLFAGTIVRFLALLLLGVALMQGATYLPQAGVTVPAQGFAYSLPFDMLVHLALLTLLTLFIVHLPLWAVAVLAVVTSPFITWTYTLLMDVAAQADAWTAVQLPFLASHGVNHAQSAQLIWVLCLGIVLVRLYDRNPRSTRRAGARRLPHLQPLHRARLPQQPAGAAHPKPGGNPVLLGRMCATALRTGGNAHPDRPPGPDVAERIHCAERNHHLRRAHRQGSHRGRALHRHRRLGHRRVLERLPAARRRNRPGLLHPLVAHGALHRRTRPPGGDSRPHLRARLAESELNTKATPSPRSCAGRGSPLYTQHLQQNLRQSLTRNLTRSLQQKYCGYDKAPVQWTGANCRDDRI